MDTINENTALLDELPNKEALPLKVFLEKQHIGAGESTYARMQRAEYIRNNKPRAKNRTGEPAAARIKNH